LRASPDDARRERRAAALRDTGSRAGESSARRAGVNVVVLAALFALALPVAAAAGRGGGDPRSTYVAPGVLQAAEKNPHGEVRVIIQSRFGASAAKRAAGAVGADAEELGIIGGAVAEVPAVALRGLSRAPGLIVTLDAPAKASGYTSTQLWPDQNGVSKLWGTAGQPAPQAPAIAIVDSGIDRTHPAFGDGSRVIHRVRLSMLAQDPTKLDGRGHGTFVAGIAAGEQPGFAGASPTSKLVDIDVMNDAGMALTSDIIRAADWILANKDRYEIRVANFSLHSTAVLSIRAHPLNRAVEKLWTSGVVVVASVGNYGVPEGPSGVPHAPGNDPLVLTVGALDLAGTPGVGDDTVAPWSAYGYTLEGFAKPEVVAAGRYMVGPVPMSATLVGERPDSLVADGYLQLSGTSFSAAVVSGIAAQLLARHPGWTPDDVKGALMSTTRPVPHAPRLAQGLGQVHAVRGYLVHDAPNGNGALARFVAVDEDGSPGRALDTAAWFEAMKGDAAWDASAWGEARWAGSSLTAAWAEAAWDASAFDDAAWTSADWADAVVHEDGADGDSFSALHAP